MRIYKIKKTWLRRTVLVLSVPVALVYGLAYVLYRAGKEYGEGLVELPAIIRDCWDGQ